MVFAMENANNTFIIDGSSNNYISKSKKVFDSFINALKELKETIYSNVEKIVHNDPFLDTLILTLKDSLNNIESILSKLNFLEDEYYDYSSIKDMIFYILDDKSLLNNISLFGDLIDSFYNLIQFKLDLSDEDYEAKYDDFSSKLIGIEQIFYTSICKPSENYDEKILSEISNSLLDL
ncbi:hypothetical protein [uncultured Methanobrevibacter sp.]|uniref:hypothetical protein n=1 Tax=uncultured Methanobrevibacter sp. TaxID=253161 RepID=UPI0025E7E187|nr:hypothetical protein [uncultured Methanobrevibacter sp.]